MTEEGPATKGLPDGWAMAELADVADCRLGKMLDQQKNLGDLRPYLRNINVQWGRVDLDDIKEMRITDDERDRYAVAPGDLLVCEGGEPGRCAIWREDREMYFQKALHRVRPHEGVSPDYVLWWLRYATGTGGLDDLFTGSTIKHLPGRQLARILIPLPPAEEQRRIAERLDEVESRRAFVSARLDAARRLLDRSRAAVLSAACSGRLTEDWREQHAVAGPGDLLSRAEDRRRAQVKRFVAPRLNRHATGNDLPDEWTLAPLGLLLEGLKYGTSKRSAYDQDGTPVLRIPNVSSGVLDVEDLKFADLDDRELDALRLHQGDLLMIRSNGSVQLVGVTVSVTSAGDGMAYAGYLMRLRVDRQFLDPEFLRLVLASPQRRHQIELPARSTSGVHNINTEEVRGLGVPVPCLAEQAEIVRRATAAMTTADHLASRIELAERALDRASHASLARAFRGKLLPTEAALAEVDGSDYESGDELLARVVSARTHETARRGKNRRAA